MVIFGIPTRRQIVPGLLPMFTDIALPTSGWGSNDQNDDRANHKPRTRLRVERVSSQRWRLSDSMDRDQANWTDVQAGDDGHQARTARIMADYRGNGSSGRVLRHWRRVRHAAAQALATCIGT
jgi:hypothetical protein